MNTCVMNDTAKNGRHVQTVVELLWEEDKPFTKLPFQVRTMVDWTPLFTAHRATNAQAKIEAAKMHASYLKVHGGKKEHASSKLQAKRIARAVKKASRKRPPSAAQLIRRFKTKNGAMFVAHPESGTDPGDYQQQR